MNKIPAFIIILLIAIFSWNCNNEDEAIKIGLLMDDFIQERWSKDREIFIKKAKELNAKVITQSSKGDKDLQLTQAREMIDKGIDVLVLVAVDMTAASEIVKIAHQSDVKVIGYDRLIKKCDLDLFVSFDNARIGEMQAGYFVKLIPKGNYALIGGPVIDNNSIQIRQGQINILQPFIDKGDIRLVMDKHVNEWDDEQGYKAMLECLMKNTCHVVLCANDALARGAIKAIEERKLTGTIAVAGQDAEKDALERIVKGTQTITIYKPIETIASNAALLAVKLATESKLNDAGFVTISNDFKMVPTMLFNPMLVNRETVKMTLSADTTLNPKHIFVEP